MPPKTEFNKEIKVQIKGILLIALSVFCFAGLKFSEQTGHLGLFINNILRTLAGETALVIPFIILVFALRIMLPSKTFNLQSRLVGIVMLMLIFTITFHFQFMLANLDTILPGEGFIKTTFLLGYSQEGGGLIGALFSVILFYLFKDIGSYIVLMTASIISLLLIFNITLNNIFGQIQTLGKYVVKSIRYLGKFFKESYQLHIRGADKKQQDKRKGLRKNKRKKMEDESRHEDSILKNELTNKDSSIIITDEANLPIDNQSADYQSERNIEMANLMVASTKSGISSKDKTPKASLMKKDGLTYVLPPVDLLTKPNRVPDQGGNRHIKERARLLESTLHSFGVKANVVNYQTGPTVTRFEVQPEAGVKVSKILNLSDDIALNMAAPVVRIEAPIPGKAALGVEVPNKVISVVHFREVLDDPAFKESSSPMTMALGKDITGVPVITTLDRMPHMLIAGATGSGKSVCLNVIICSLLFKAHPDDVKILMIDPKMVELSIFNGIPHLISPVITDPKKASAALKSMIKEMIKRYDLFAREGVREINSYNEKCAAGQVDGEFLPYIVVIIDELADLMLVSPAEVEDSIARLAQMARASGIHLLIATQRPSVDVLTGIIKANIPSRIAFTVSSQVDSRTILDMAGAEKLLGRGDMLFYPVGMVKPLRVQSAFISNKDLKGIVSFIKAQSPADNPSDKDIINDEASEEDLSQIDELFPDAVELIVRTGHASISLLQRRFRIGYSRAARLIDDLEVKGVVGRHEGSKPREIIMPLEQASKLYEEYRKRLS